MAERRKRYDCDGCRRADPGCSLICEAIANQESEVLNMKLRIVSTAPLEITNLVYLPKRLGFWQRITRTLAKLLPL
jgi:hypothetical protein